MLMDVLSAIKRVLLLEDFGSAMVLTMRILLVQWSSLLLSGFFSLLQSLEVGLSVSLMCIMLSFMEYWRRRSICGSRLALQILTALIISVVSPKHSMA
jgi:hypothetical protein